MTRSTSLPADHSSPKISSKLTSKTSPGLGPSFRKYGTNCNQGKYRQIASQHQTHRHQAPERTCVDVGNVFLPRDGGRVGERRRDRAWTRLPAAPRRKPRHILAIAQQPAGGAERVPLRVVTWDRSHGLRIHPRKWEQHCPAVLYSFLCALNSLRGVIGIYIDAVKWLSANLSKVRKVLCLYELDAGLNQRCAWECAYTMQKESVLLKYHRPRQVEIFLG